MSLTTRISFKGSDVLEPEDYLGTALGVLFPDDVMNQHGDADNSLSYESPRLPKPLLIDLGDPKGEDDRQLFSHYLWNASLLLAELVERDSMDDDATPDSSRGGDALYEVARGQGLGGDESFDIRGLETLELGAGTALPSIMAALLGAKRVVVTDYPAPSVLKTLADNVTNNTKPELSPAAHATPMTPASSVLVTGHSWGELTDESNALTRDSRHAFDRILVADCLWMPWQHDNLRRSIAHFLRREAGARAWVVAGFHTGTAKMRGFFDADELRAVGLQVERRWERDCDGVERPWKGDVDEVAVELKRWLCVAILKRVDDGGGGGGDAA